MATRDYFCVLTAKRVQSTGSAQVISERTVAETVTMPDSARTEDLFWKLMDMAAERMGCNFTDLNVLSFTVLPAHLGPGFSAGSL